MTQKEFIGKLACKLQLDESKISEVLGAISNILADQILNNNEIKIEDFGIFNTHKYNEYILVDSNTGERFLMPPEVVVSFEPFVDESLESNSQLVDISFEVDDLLKSKINSAFHNFEPTLINEGVEFLGIEVITTEEDVIEIEDRETVVSESEKEIESKDSDFQVSLDAYAQSDLLTELKIDSERHPTPVLRPDKCSRPKSRPREGSRILFPVLGGVVIVMATLFFFNGLANRKNDDNSKRIKN